MTAQTPDVIVIDGVEHELLAELLGGLLQALPDAPELAARDTALWRGYLARWRVDGDRLYLDDVRGWLRNGAEAAAGVVLPGVELPIHASWVTSSFVVARGDQVRHVHRGFESRYEHEIELRVEDGVVVDRRELAQVGAMGMAGPYRLEESLLGFLSGGGFGQLIAAFDVDGRPLVAKAARPSGGGYGTESWIDTTHGRKPVHVPAKALRRVRDEWGAGDSWQVEPVGMDVTIAVLRAEHEILERDVGTLLPASLGMWEHDPSGTPVLVMEKLVGRQPKNAYDVRAVLAAVADAVDRATFDAHGDLKLEHVFIDDDGRVRICDPAPRFPDPAWRGFTLEYNPKGWSGAAADAVACASMLRYVDGPSGRGSGWAAELLDADDPPEWALSQRGALARLDAELGALPPPSSWSFDAPPASAPMPPPSPPPWAPAPPGLPPSDNPAHGGVLTPNDLWPWPIEPPEPAREVWAAADRLVIAAVDMLDGYVMGGRYQSVGGPELGLAEEAAMARVIDSLAAPDSGFYGVAGPALLLDRLTQWVRGALLQLRKPRFAYRIAADAARMGIDVLAVAVVRATDAWQAESASLATSTGTVPSPPPPILEPQDLGHVPLYAWFTDPIPPEEHRGTLALRYAWRGLLDDGTATFRDLVWVTASMVVDALEARRSRDPDWDTNMAWLLHDIGKRLGPDGILAWGDERGPVVVRPPTYEFRAFFDPGSDVLLWSANDAANQRWDGPVEQWDLVIPTSLAQRITDLVDAQYQLFHECDEGCKPYPPARWNALKQQATEVIEELRSSLGFAYTVHDQV